MKYELTKNTINRLGKTLYQVKALKDFSGVRKGDLGGYIENVDNLSQSDNAWVYGNAWISGKAMVFDNARVSGDVMVYDNARVYDNAVVFDNAELYGNAIVCGNARVFGNAEVYGNARVSIGSCTDKAINLINLCQYNITSYNDYIIVGCKVYTKSKWLELLNDKNLFLDECRDRASQKLMYDTVIFLLNATRKEL